MTKMTCEIHKEDSQDYVLSSLPLSDLQNVWFADFNSKLTPMKTPNPLLISNGVYYKSGQLHVFAIFSINVQMWKQAELVTTVVTGQSLTDICLKLYLHSEQVPNCCTSRWLLTPFSRTHFKVRALSPLKEKCFIFFNVYKTLLGLGLALINFKGSWKKN